MNQIRLLITNCCEAECHQEWLIIFVKFKINHPIIIIMENYHRHKRFFVTFVHNGELFPTFTHPHWISQLKTCPYKSLHSSYTLLRLFKVGSHPTPYVRKTIFFRLCFFCFHFFLSIKVNIKRLSIIWKI